MSSGGVRRADTALMGFAAMSMELSVPWPWALVLTQREQLKYQMLFRHLFFCRHVQLALGKSWLGLQSCKELDLRAELTHAHMVRQRMSHFLHNLLLFMTGESVEPRWHAFEEEARAAGSVDQLRRAHGSFLDGCLHDCLLTAPDLLRPLTKLVTLCLLFANRMAQDVERHRPDEEEVSKEAGLGTPLAAARRKRRRELTAHGSFRGNGRGEGDGGEEGEARRLTREERVRAMTTRKRAARLRLMEARTRHTMLQQGWQVMVHKSQRLFDELLRQFMARLIARAEGLTVGNLNLGAGAGAGLALGGGATRSHVQQLCMRLDFNGFYSKKLNLRLGGARRD